MVAVEPRLAAPTHPTLINPGPSYATPPSCNTAITLRECGCSGMGWEEYRVTRGGETSHSWFAKHYCNSICATHAHSSKPINKRITRENAINATHATPEYASFEWRCCVSSGRCLFREKLSHSVLMQHRNSCSRNPATELQGGALHRMEAILESESDARRARSYWEYAKEIE